ncbi:MAG: DUF58 domain-containing protein [Crocinitomicaceae bacterium]|nr:DUF58 domain-containing protein [Crocinitomicaceae bacterium]
MSKLNSFRLTPRFFIVLGAIVVLYAIGFVSVIVEFIATLCLSFLILISVVEAIALFSNRVKLKAERGTGRLFSLGDENPVHLVIKNEGKIGTRMVLYDELPFQFQLRNFRMEVSLPPGEEKRLKYILRPLKRGEYHFGKLNAITTVLSGVIGRRLQLASAQKVEVFPSIIQMKKYELLAFARISTLEGIKKVRRLGHSYEFEQIKQYSLGDDVRSVNWKATGRKNALMVNQYEDERAQQVYTIIDKSRSMHMPFNGLSLLDYSINTSLVIANIALKKSDKAGLITFSNKIGTTLPAERSSQQLKKILRSLYFEKPQVLEADYDLMYRAVKNVIRGRSLIFLYLNFESAYALERALPVLQKINQLHLLVVMIFENTELLNYSAKKSEYISDIYAQTIARKLVWEKKQIVSKLRKYNIQTILSRPEDLSINTVNKYLELKAKGMT